MKKGDPLLSNKWFQTGNIVVNLDWIAFIEFDEGEATVFMAAGKRKYKKIHLSDKDAIRLKEIFHGIRGDD